MAGLNYYNRQQGTGTTVGQGPKGDPGTPGPIGTLHGTSAPSDSIGVDGQGFFNTNTGDLYVKASGTWGSPKINLKGINGTNGKSVTNATLDGSGHLILTLSDSTTFDVGTVKGTNGTNGIDGTNGAQGNGFASPVAWQANTAYNVVNNQRPVVTYQGSTYFSNTNVPSRTTFTAGDWSVMAAKGTDGAASIPSDVVRTSQANNFGKNEQSGGLLVFESYPFTTLPVLTITAANEANYLGKEIGLTSNINTQVFEVRIGGDVSKGFNVKIRREGTAKVKIVPDTTNALGHNTDIQQITATTPAYIAAQYGAVLIEVRYKASGSQCDFFVDGVVSTS